MWRGETYRVGGERGSRGSRDDLPLDARQAAASARGVERDTRSSKSKFLLEPLEPRVLLSAVSLLGEVYRSLVHDEAERDGVQFAVIVEQIDAATSAEISAADSQNSGSAASETAPVVAWGNGWQAHTAATEIPAPTDEAQTAVPAPVAEAETATAVVLVQQAATPSAAPQNSDSRDDSSLAVAGQDQVFTGFTTTSDQARAPPADSFISAALFAAESLSDKHLGLSDSPQGDEGGPLSVNNAPVSASFDDALARAPPITDAEIAQVLDYAVQLWAASGVAAENAARLANLQVRIADL